MEFSFEKISDSNKEALAKQGIETRILNQILKASYWVVDPGHEILFFFLDGISLYSDSPMHFLLMWNMHDINLEAFMSIQDNGGTDIIICWKIVSIKVSKKLNADSIQIMRMIEDIFHFYSRNSNDLNIIGVNISSIVQPQPV